MGLSLRERDRRYSAIRELMKRDGLDCLVIASRDTYSTRGNVRYVTNHGNSFGEDIVFFPAEGEPSVLCGAHAAAVERGGWVKNILPPNNGYHQNFSEAIDTVKRELARLDKGNRIGIVGRTFISVPVYLAIEEKCANRVIDSAEIFNQLRNIKSAEEIEAMRTAALIADKVFLRIKDMLRPGLTDFRIYGEAKALIHEMGCEYSMELIGGFPYGRVFGAHDIVNFEFTPAYEGYYGQLLSNIPVAGQFPPSMNEVIAVWEEALAAGVESLRPGKKVLEVHQAVSAVKRQHGDTTPGGRMGHSLGLDAIDSWEVTATDRTELKPGMTLAFHPGVAVGGLRAIGGYTYLITESGAEKLSRVDLYR